MRFCVDEISAAPNTNATLFYFVFFFTSNYVADMTEEKKDRNFFTLISPFLKSSLKKKERKGKLGATLGSQNI